MKWFNFSTSFPGPPSQGKGPGNEVVNFSVYCLVYMRAGFLLVIGANISLENGLIWKNLKTLLVFKHKV